MAIDLVRVIHSQVRKPSATNSGSILLDKIDESQGHAYGTPYAQNRKQQLYVPYEDTIVSGQAGFVDLIQTDRVKLQIELANGVIKKLEEAGHVDVLVVNSALIATPVVSNTLNAVGTTTITGTTLLSVSPVETKVYIVNGGTTYTLGESDFTIHNATTITITDATLGATPIAGWTVQVYANKKLSNIFTIL